MFPVIKESDYLANVSDICIAHDLFIAPAPTLCAAPMERAKARLRTHTHMHTHTYTLHNVSDNIHPAQCETVSSATF